MKNVANGLRFALTMVIVSCFGVPGGCARHTNEASNVSPQTTKIEPLEELAASDGGESCKPERLRAGERQLGTGSTDVRDCDQVSTEPLPPLQLSLGENSTCAWTSNGKLHCWGDGPPNPVDTKIEDIVIRAKEGCVWKADGTLNCWCEEDPEYCKGGKHALDGLNGVIDVAEPSRDDFICVLFTDGKILCGPNGLEVEVETQVSDAVKLASASSSYCVLTKAQEVLCWGQVSSHHQLGRGLDPEQAWRPLSPTQLLPHTTASISNGWGYYS